jgi:group II intron reverse transcriptase/maturase
MATQSANCPDAGLMRLREAAMSNRRLAFNNLLHHITVDRLKLAYEGLAKSAAPGVDGEDWASFGVDLDGKLERLHAALHTGRYRAQPVRRQWIPKADGRQRPLGIACVEDKVVQQALATVLTAIFEVDFLGFSYGFRPHRSQHDALDAVYMAVTTQKVSWLLDADIEACFDRIEHSKLMAVLRERIADRRVLRLIEGTLKAGVLDDGTWHASTIGVPQGAVISPLLANVFLHAAIDRWVHGWRQVRARGQVCVVRYADDFVVGCQYRSDGELLRTQLAARLARFGLTLHPAKTRLLEFGRFAISNRRERGLGKPESFGFLGFTHRCVTRSDGEFAVQRRTISKRLRAFLQEVKRQLQERWAHTPREQGEWLGRVVRGYLQYHGVPGNRAALETVRREVNRMWLWVLRRRSQRHALPWAKFTRWVKRWIPSVRIVHPYPNQRFAF